MKHIITKTFEALLILLSVFILGMFIPFITSLIIVLTTDITITDFTTFGPFWFFVVVGWCIAACYLNEEIKNK